MMGAALAAAGVALACSQVFSDGGTGDKPIRVAWAGPMSPSAEDARSTRRAVELVFARANAAGGIAGRELVLEAYDDRNDPVRAREVASAIADDDDTVAVIGHHYSSTSIPAGAVYATRGIPAVAAVSTSVPVTRDNPWYFRVVYNDRAQGRFLTAYVREVLGAKDFGIVHESAAYGAYLADVIAETAPATGLHLAGRWAFDPADPDLVDRLAEIAAEVTGPAGPEVLVIAMQPEAGVPFVKELRRRNFRGELVGSDGFASRAFVGGFQDEPEERNRPGYFINGMYVSTPFLFDTGGRLAGEFFREYQAQYDETAGWMAAFAADAANVLVEALRRGSVSPRAATIEQDREALRDALAAIGPLDAVEGVTGPTWFDRAGDARKPVPMGRFVNGEIVSSYAQLRPLAGLVRAGDLGPETDPERLVVLGDTILYRTDVAQVGMRARRFSDVDFSRGTFSLDFDIWFRHDGDRGVEDIEFTNAAARVELGEPVEAINGDLQYRLYRVQGVFRIEPTEAEYGGHVLALSFRHRDLTRNDLIYAVDRVGMEIGGALPAAPRARLSLGPNSDWVVRDVLFFEDEVDEHALGHPGYLHGGKAVRQYSQLTIGANVRRQALSLRGLIPARYQIGLLALSLVGLAVLALQSGFPKPRWVLQAGFALLLLLTSEPLLGNWVGKSGYSYYAGQVTRVYDVLWWLVPAILVSLAIDRFLWTRTEMRSGHSVPTVLRYFVAALVYLIAFFCIVAFVYDYRLTGLIATSGVVFMIIGLAVQLNITNLFAGVALNLERPFRVGDWIQIHGRTPDLEEGVIGRVTDINWRTTRLRTADDTEVVIPNGVISEKTITNFMAPGEMSRFELRFTIPPAWPPEMVIPIMQKGVDEVAGVDHAGPLGDPPPKIRINRTTERGIEYAVRYRLIPREVSPSEARHTINSAVLRHLRDAHIQLAYPDAAAPAVPENRTKPMRA